MIGRVDGCNVDVDVGGIEGVYFLSFCTCYFYGLGS